MSQNEAWAPDPTGRHELRWWDGLRWTDHVANAGVAGHDPLTPPAMPPGDPHGAAVPVPMTGTQAGWVTGGVHRAAVDNGTGGNVGASPFPNRTQGPARGPRASWVSFPDAVGLCLSKYADLSGRASRSEYWWWTLSMVITLTIAYVLVVAIILGTGGNEGVLLLLGAVWLGLFLPSLAVAVRRLHDIGQSGWWLLIGFVPFGGIVLLVFYVMETQPHVNAYGPPPSYPTT